VRKTLTAQKPEIRRTLRILYETVRVPSHPVAVHPRGAAAGRRRVCTAFFDMEKTDSGRGLLSKIPIKTVGPAEMEDYTPLKEMGLEAFYVDSPH
jgi:phosphonate transport system substrate-binding protein